MSASEIIKDQIELVKAANTYRGRISAGAVFAITSLEAALRRVEAEEAGPEPIGASPGYGYIESGGSK